MLAAFEKCCKKNGHRPTLCQEAGNEMFNMHIGDTFSLESQNHLCTEMVLLGKTHGEWLKDKETSTAALAEQAFDRTLKGKERRRRRAKQHSYGYYKPNYR